MSIRPIKRLSTSKPTLTVINFKDTGHWLMEERPKETMDALLKFL